MMDIVLQLGILIALLSGGWWLDAKIDRARRRKATEAWIERFEDSAVRRSQMPRIGGGGGRAS